ncbi:MAG: hypothetical protein AAGD01_18970 [Acidobacteriota bacterium]
MESPVVDSAPLESPPATSPQEVRVPPPPISGAPLASPSSASGLQPPLLRKSPALAVFLGLYPGLGHVYAGLYRRGIVFFFLALLCFGTIAAFELPAFALLLSFIWLFNLLDAHRQTHLVNMGYVADLGVVGDPASIQALSKGLPNWSSALLTMGVGSVVFGSLGWLERLGIWRWSYLGDYWFVLFLAAGAWLIFVALRQRRAQGEIPTQGASW